MKKCFGKFGQKGCFKCDCVSACINKRKEEINGEEAKKANK